MRVSRAKAAENRERVIKVASRLFREHGFDGVGVDAIMAGAGLTHGGFYNSFDSKQTLAVEACKHAMAESAKKWDATLNAATDDPLGAWAGRYLSRDHCSNAGNGCVFAALAADARWQGRAVKRVFAAGLRASIERMMAVIPGRSLARKRERALATLATLVGAMVLARAVDDPAFSEEILKAASVSLSVQDADRGRTN